MVDVKVRYFEDTLYKFIVKGRDNRRKVVCQYFSPGGYLRRTKTLRKNLTDDKAEEVAYLLTTKCPPHLRKG